MKQLEILKKLNVLYVDDDPKARDSLEKILKYYFAEVHVASGAYEAMEIYRKGRCNLLLVDYDMPIMNGYEFLKEIREENYLIPAAIISSYDDKEKLFNAVKLELVDYLVKPYDLDELKKLFSLCVEWMEKKTLLEIRFSDDVSYSYLSKKLTVKSKEITLSPSEFKILENLLLNENRLVPYDNLLELIGENSTHRSLTSQIHKLKKKLTIDIIKNVKDLGYILTIK